MTNNPACTRPGSRTGASTEEAHRTKVLNLCPQPAQPAIDRRRWNRKGGLAKGNLYESNMHRTQGRGPNMENPKRAQNGKPPTQPRGSTYVVLDVCYRGSTTRIFSGLLTSEPDVAKMDALWYGGKRLANDLG